MELRAILPAGPGGERIVATSLSAYLHILSYLV
jgi:hypothetical protein